MTPLVFILQVKQKQASSERSFSSEHSSGRNAVDGVIDDLVDEVSQLSDSDGTDAVNPPVFLP
eukprot:scaffold237401_cov34-Prasinocladus_malaysianus.AAC.1